MKKITFTRNKCTYDTKKLWRLSNGCDVKRISIKLLQSNLDKDNWTVRKGVYVTPNQVMANPYVSLADFKRILNADLSYPILVHAANYDILDGLHRLSLAVIEKRKTINVILINQEMIDKCKIKMRA